MTPSPYQQAIFDFVLSGSGNAVVNAVAGSGKTTTIVAAAKLLRPGGHYKFLAFNKSIAEELKTKLPYFVTASTFHAECFAAYKRAISGVKRPEAGKTKWLCKDANLIPDREFWQTFPWVERMVSFAKASGLEPAEATPAALQSIADFHDMDDPPARAFALVQKLLFLSVEDDKRLDFDDMLWLTYLKNIPFVPQADFVFVDEAQDLSEVQHALLERMVKPNGGRLVAVGDKHQAIYGFRGAHTNGMDELTKRFNATALPLSISYRCSQKVVEEAQRILTKPTAQRPPAREANKFLTEALDEDEDYLPDFN